MSAEYETIECATRTHQHPVGSCPHCTIATLLELARRYASECPRCTGEGALRSGGPPCDECADIRAVLDAIDRPEVTP